MIIRPATLKDIPAINEIYNEAVRNTTATFDTEPKSLDEREAWFALHDDRHPVLAAVEESVVGWAALSPWSERLAYRDTAEVSVYVHSDRRGMGIGSLLLEALITNGKQANLHTLIARIADGNQASVAMHRRLGFEFIGTMKEVGLKFGRRIDVQLFQFIFKDTIRNGELEVST
jgi:phosphinothricin acetyltransferase